MTPTLLVDAGRVSPKNRGILRDTLTVSVLSILAKFAGAGKAVVIAGVFGSGPALDGYLLAFLLPSVLADTFCGALVPVTVPRLVELEHRGGGSQPFYSRVLRRSLSYASFGSAALAIGIISAMAFGVPPRWHTIGMLALLMLPVIPCNALANIWRAALNSRREFAIPALTVVVTPAVIVFFVLLAGRWGGVTVLAIGTAAGAAVEAALLGAAARRSGFRVGPQEAAPMYGFRREYGYLAASAAVSGGTVLLGQTMAASLGAGNVSVLNYGTRLAGVLMSIGPAALSVTVLPRFSQMAAEQDWESLKTSLRSLLLGSGAICGAAAVALILCSTPIVRLTLQRGAFTTADTSAVAAVQAWSLLQMPFVVGITILMRVFSVLNSNRLLLPLSGAALAVTCVLNYVLMFRYGVTGISMASSIAQALLFAAMAALVFGRRARILERS